MASINAPGLNYPDSDCIVVINGTFTPQRVVGSTACTLYSFQDLLVTFTSGANSAFNLQFWASGTFTATALTTSPQGYPMVKKARVAVLGGGPAEDSLTGSASIDHTFFDVTFPIGLEAGLCSPSATLADHKAGAVRPVLAVEADGSADNGTVRVRQ